MDEAKKHSKEVGDLVRQCHLIATNNRAGVSMPWCLLSAINKRYPDGLPDRFYGTVTVDIVIKDGSPCNVQIVDRASFSIDSLRDGPQNS